MASSSSSSKKEKEKALKEALRALAQGDAASAADLCVGFLKTKEGRDNPDALIYLGKSQFLLNEGRKAIKAYKEATRFEEEGSLRAWKGIVEASSILPSSSDSSSVVSVVAEAFQNVLSSLSHHHAKWYSLLESFWSFLERARAPEDLVREARRAAVVKTDLEGDLRLRALKGYCDYCEGAGLEVGLEVLGEVYDRTESGPPGSASEYHRRYLRGLRPGDRAKRVAETLVRDFEEDQFTTEILAASLSAGPPPSNPIDLVSEGRYPAMPVSRGLRKLLLKLAHRRPWLDESWLNVAWLALQERSYTSTSPGTPNFLARVLRRRVQAMCAKADPEKVSSLHWMALSQILAERDPEKALKCIDKSISTPSSASSCFSPSSPLVPALQRVHRGMLLCTTGRWEGAVALLQGSCTAAGTPFGLLAKRCLAKALMALGRWEEASGVLAGVASSHHRSLSDLGWCLHKLGGREEEACELLERAARGGQSSSKDRYRLGKAYWRRGGRFREDRSLSYTSFLKAASGAELGAGAPPNDVSELEEVRSKAFRRLGDFYGAVAKDKARALRCYRRALSVSPKRVGAGRQACLLMHEGGQTLEAIELCNQALDDSKYDEEVMRWALKPLALALVETRQYQQALPVFQKAIRAAKQDPFFGEDAKQQCWEGLALCYQETKRYQSAIKAYEHVLESVNPKSAFSMIQLGKIYSEFLLDHQVSLRMFRGAEDLLSQDSLGETVPPVSSGACKSLLNQSRKHTRIGARGSAGKLVGEALHLLESTRGGQHLKAAASSTYWKLVGDLNIERVKLSRNQSKSGLAKRARRAYAKVLHSTPFSSKCWHDLALSFYLAGEEGGCADKARANALRGLSVNSKDAALWAAMGLVAEGSEPKLKEYCFARSLQLDPSNADTWVGLASLYLSKGAADLAQQCLQTARIHRPNCPAAWECEGVLRCSMDGTFNASETFEYAQRLSNTPFANKCYALEALGKNGGKNLEKAKVAINFSREFGSEDSRSHLCSGLISEHFGCNEEASCSYRRALDLQSAESLESLEIKKNLARVLLKLGEAEEALGLYNALAADPKFTWDDSSRITYLQAKLETSGSSLSEGDLDFSALARVDGKSSGSLQQFRAKIQLRKVLETSGIEEGTRHAMQLTGQFVGDDEAKSLLAVDCWLMVLVWAVKAQSGVDAVLGHMRDSPLWYKMKDEAMRLLALAHRSLSHSKQAYRCLAKAVHNDPQDSASYSSLLHLSSPSSTVNAEQLESLLRLEDTALVFRFLHGLRARDSGSRDVLAKLVHKNPEARHLWKMIPSL
ncbi:tetratricopeptide repeat domain-containing protein [Chloropicon primus]|nr:tetratricopeptide repeat domain-containing protein [Chloropicon primus]